MEKTWTIIQLLNETQKYFEKKGIETARLDAEILLAFSLKKERINLYIDFESPVNDKELSGFRELVKRRAKREPVAYITGFKEFWSVKLKVTDAVLIPRPETEMIVEQAVKLINGYSQSDQKIAAIDVGTGSGAISIAMAKEFRNISIISVDISISALKIAKKNIKLNGFSERVFPVCADSINGFKDKECFDFIFSNPPYVVKSDISGLQPEIAEYEPFIAFDGGSDGLDFYRNNLQRFGALLKPGGYTVLEIGEDQAGFVSCLFDESGFFEEISVVKDYASKDRVITARKKNNS